MKLPCVFPSLLDQKKQYRVEVGFEINPERLVTRFEVHAPLPLTINPKIPLGSSGKEAWGLWETDVVEVFVSTRNESDKKGYWEFQISPLGQTFQLRVFEPRLRTSFEEKSGFSGRSQIVTPFHWRATLEVPLPLNGFDQRQRAGTESVGSELIGGAFACLGPSDQRSYYGLFLPPQEKPDFHLPKYFGPLSTPPLA